MGIIAWIVPGLGAGLLNRSGNPPGGYRRDPPTLTRQRGGCQEPAPAAADQLVHQDKPPR